MNNPSLTSIIGDNQTKNLHAISIMLHPNLSKFLTEILPNGNQTAQTSDKSGPSEVKILETIPQKVEGGFCIPVNPKIEIIRIRINSNLEKIRTSRNFLGMKRKIQTYTTPQDPNLFMNQYSFDKFSELVIPNEPPPLFRFSFLIDRAKYFVQIAQQLESQLLTSYQQGENERYNLMKARHDLEISEAKVKLGLLKVNEAKSEIDATDLKQFRAEYVQNHFQLLINQGMNYYEQQAFTDMEYAAQSSAGYNSSMRSRDGFTIASFERRMEEWQHQEYQAVFDVSIAFQEKKVARDQLATNQQDLEISSLEQAFNATTITYLGEKFTNQQLYDWMVQVLSNLYRNYLNHTTLYALMAQRSLEFERQEAISIIAPSYSTIPQKGLLVAEQLLNDINNLDQHRLTTEKRRKEITKVISLAVSTPIEFIQFRKEGLINFGTPMEWFDQDFPGHYMRLIKSISLTVIALIPPPEGIHATLSNNGISRVIVNPSVPDVREISRYPESIAVTIPNAGTGLFEMRLDDPMLLPFEGSGVDTFWTLEMPKGANQFDYDSLVDVLFTIRYTALDDPIYRKEVVKSLQLPVSRTTSISLRNSFPDSWYQLRQSDFIKDTSFSTQFEVQRDNFLPNDEFLRISRLTILFLQDPPVKIPVQIEYQPYDSTETYIAESDFDWSSNETKSKSPISLLSFSHYRNNDSNLVVSTTLLTNFKQPFGKWSIHIQNGGTKLDNTPINATTYPDLFKNAELNNGHYKLNLGWLKDILFIITYDVNIDYKFEF